MYYRPASEKRSSVDGSGMRLQFSNNEITSKAVDARRVDIGSVLSWVRLHTDLVPNCSSDYLEDLVSAYLDSDCRCLDPGDLYEAVGIVGEAGFIFVVKFWKVLLKSQSDTTSQSSSKHTKDEVGVADLEEPQAQLKPKSRRRRFSRFEDASSCADVHPVADSSVLSRETTAVERQNVNSSPEKEATSGGSISKSRDCGVNREQHVINAVDRNISSAGVNTNEKTDLPETTRSKQSDHGPNQGNSLSLPGPGMRGGSIEERQLDCCELVGTESEDISVLPRSRGVSLLPDQFRRDGSAGENGPASVISKDDHADVYDFPRRFSNSRRIDRRIEDRHVHSNTKSFQGVRMRRQGAHELITESRRYCTSPGADFLSSRPMRPEYRDTLPGFERAYDESNVLHRDRHSFHDDHSAPSYSRGGYRRRKESCRSTSEQTRFDLEMSKRQPSRYWDDYDVEPWTSRGHVAKPSRDEYYRSRRPHREPKRRKTTGSSSDRDYALVSCERACRAREHARKSGSRVVSPDHCGEEDGAECGRTSRRKPLLTSNRRFMDDVEPSDVFDTCASGRLLSNEVANNYAMGMAAQCHADRADSSRMREVEFAEDRRSEEYQRGKWRNRRQKSHSLRDLSRREECVDRPDSVAQRVSSSRAGGDSSSTPGKVGDLVRDKPDGHTVDKKARVGPEDELDGAEADMPSESKRTADNARKLARMKKELLLKTKVIRSMKNVGAKRDDNQRSATGVKDENRLSIEYPSV